MSSHVQYDPKLFVLRRAQTTASTLDEFLTGAPIYQSSSVWTVIESATVSLSASYTPNSGQGAISTGPLAADAVSAKTPTLLIEAETATVSLSFWDEPGTILYPGDRIEARYSGERLFYGIVTTTSVDYATDSDARRHGAHRRVDFTATAAGVYAVMMGRIITWTNLPAEKAITRIRRWVTVNGWD